MWSRVLIRFDNSSRGQPSNRSPIFRGRGAFPIHTARPSRLCLEGEGSVLSQQCLATPLSTNKNNLADLLNRMEEKKLIKRHGNKTDQRNKSVSITKDGEIEFFRARDHALTLQGEILACFNQEEQRLLVSCFSRLNDRLDEISWFMEADFLITDIPQKKNVPWAR